MGLDQYLFIWDEPIDIIALNEYYETEEDEREPTEEEAALLFRESKLWLEGLEFQWERRHDINGAFSMLYDTVNYNLQYAELTLDDWSLLEGLDKSPEYTEEDAVRFKKIREALESGEYVYYYPWW